jgi:hypothetical protein
MLVASRCNAIGFSDVNKNDWYYESISELESFGVVNGYEDGSFRPKGKVKVTEFLKMILETEGFDVVKKDLWHEGYIDKSRELKLFDEEYTYSEDIKRKDVALIIKRISESDRNYKSINFIDLENIEPKYVDAIAYVYNKEIINGYPDGTFRPEETLTRAEAATLIKKFIEWKDKKGKYTEEDSLTWEEKVDKFWEEEFVEPEFEVVYDYPRAFHAIRVINYDRMNNPKKIYLSESRINCLNVMELNTRDNFNLKEGKWLTYRQDEWNSTGKHIKVLKDKYYTTKDNFNKGFKISSDMHLDYKIELKFYGILEGSKIYKEKTYYLKNIKAKKV